MSLIANRPQSEKTQTNIVLLIYDLIVEESHWEVGMAKKSKAKKATKKKKVTKKKAKRRVPKVTPPLPVTGVLL